MAARSTRWRPPAICARWAFDYYREFFSQFPKIRFAVDVNSCCDDFSLELAKLSDRFLGIGLSPEALEVARTEAVEKGNGLTLDFQNESLEELFDRLEDQTPSSLPDFVTACNAFGNESDQKDGVQLVSQLILASYLIDSCISKNRVMISLIALLLLQWLPYSSVFRKFSNDIESFLH